MRRMLMLLLTVSLLSACSRSAQQAEETIVDPAPPNWVIAFASQSAALEGAALREIDAIPLERFRRIDLIRVDGLPYLRAGDRPVVGLARRRAEAVAQRLRRRGVAQEQLWVVENEEQLIPQPDRNYSLGVLISVVFGGASPERRQHAR